MTGMRCCHGLTFLLLASCSHLAPVRQDDTVRFPLDKAAEAWRQLAAGGLSPVEEEHELTAYRQAVQQVALDLARQSPKKWKGVRRVPGGSQRWSLRIDPGSAHSHAVWQPGWLDDLNRCRETKEPPAAGLKRPGIGAPLLGVRKSRDSDPAKNHIPPKGQFLPVTAMIEFDAQMQPTLRLYDPREVREVRVGPRTHGLAADFITPTHEALEKKGFLSMAFGGLLRPGQYLEKRGLFMLEPYRRDKIPVLFVHGLMSDPHIWEQQAAALEADPDLGKRIQCWYFVYPTGLPIPGTAGMLRDALRDAGQTADPEHDDPGLRKMLVIGHSMGGILTRMQVVDSGDRFWKTWFAVPPDEVPLNEDTHAMLMKALFFQHNPDIKRVVFIATPHRGSFTADGWIGRAGSWLIRLPREVLGLYAQLITLDLRFINPERREFRKLRRTSIDNLAPQHPLFSTLAQCPVQAPHHSIIGQLIRKEDRRETTDGLVPYWSSQLPTAESEVIVPYWHSCVEKPETVAEVHRIARLHVLGR